jgi:hypothetical protein
MSNKTESQVLLAHELRRLDAQIALVTRAILYLIAAAITIYAVWFLYVLRSEIPESGAAWGTFGDYFGGLLNPVIAFTALYWLTRSVRLQKEELNETRSALEDSADAQKNQVAVASWTALINANTAQIQQLQYQLSQINQRISDAEPKHGQVFIEQDRQQRMAFLMSLSNERKPIEDELAERARIGKGYEQRLVSLVETLQGDA